MTDKLRDLSFQFNGFEFSASILVDTCNAYPSTTHKPTHLGKELLVNTIGVAAEDHYREHKFLHDLGTWARKKHAQLHSEGGNA